MPRQLSDADVAAIRHAAIDHDEHSHDIARRYDVDPAYVRRIVRGEVRQRAGGPTRNLAPSAKPAIERRTGFSTGAALDLIPDLVAEYGPFEFTTPVEPEPAVRRLLEAIGVAVKVDAQSVPHVTALALASARVHASLSPRRGGRGERRARRGGASALEEDGRGELRRAAAGD